MQLDLSRVDRWKKILSNPRQEREGTRAQSQKTNRKEDSMCQTLLEEPAVTIPEAFKMQFKISLRPHQRIPAGQGFFRRLFLMGFQQKTRHGRHQRSRKQIGSEHRENDCFGERHKQVAGHASKKKHENKNNTNGKR